MVQGQISRNASKLDIQKLRSKLIAQPIIAQPITELICATEPATAHSVNNSIDCSQIFEIQRAAQQSTGQTPAITHSQAPGFPNTRKQFCQHIFVEPGCLRHVCEPPRAFQNWIANKKFDVDVSGFSAQCHDLWSWLRVGETGQKPAIGDN